MQTKSTRCCRKRADFRPTMPSWPDGKFVAYRGESGRTYPRSCRCVPRDSNFMALSGGSRYALISIETAPTSKVENFTTQFKGACNSKGV